MTITQTMSNIMQVDQSDIQFRFGKLDQGNDSVADYYSRLKRCNDIVNFSENHLRNEFVRGLTPVNQRFVIIHGLGLTLDELGLTLDELVEKLSMMENSDFIDSV